MKFKKRISILILIFLLLSNMGLIFSIHYCGDEISSVSVTTKEVVNPSEDKCCGIIEKDSKCCNDKIIKSVKKIDQITTKKMSFEPVVTYTGKKITIIGFESFNKRHREITHYYCDANSPPLYLLYNQYTFYS